MQKLILISSVLLVTACTQKAAPVALRGHEDFSSKYASNSSASSSYRASSSYKSDAASYGYTQADREASSAPTSSAASISSVGVSDLPPPSKSSSSSTSSWKSGSVESKEVAPVKTVSKAEIREEPKNEIKPVVLSSKESESSFIWPVEGKVINKFGPSGKGSRNDGLSIAAESGEPVYAASGGEVAFVGDQLKGYGNMVIIKHAGNRHTTYAHLERAAVERYDHVKQGEVIGYVGSSGRVSKSQLYFAVREGKSFVNPEKILPSQMASVEKTSVNN